MAKLHAGGKWSSALRRVIMLAGLTLLTACYGHSLPLENPYVISPEGPLRAELFVDAYGNFYPEGWRWLGGGDKAWKKRNLFEGSAEVRGQVEAGEERQLKNVAAFGQKLSRVFILIHGFNNTYTEAAAPFDDIESKLNLKPGDGVIRFNWDGLTGSGPAALGIWFPAAHNSKLAGSRGLRRVLDRFAGKEIYIIAHSRGASVVLSALHNPVYDEAFRTKIGNRLGAGFLTPPALASRNTIHILLLAPAIGRPDFCNADQQGEFDLSQSCADLPPLSDQVSSLRYSLNEKDPVLRKGVGLSDVLNPTGLGTKPGVGDALILRYPLMTKYKMEKPKHFHAFGCYAAEPIFTRMLADDKIARVPLPPPALLPPPSPERRRCHLSKAPAK